MSSIIIFLLVELVAGALVCLVMQHRNMCVYNAEMRIQGRCHGVALMLIERNDPQWKEKTWDVLDKFPHYTDLLLNHLELWSYEELMKEPLEYFDKLERDMTCKPN